MTDKPNDSRAPEHEDHDERALREAEERMLLHDTDAAEEGASEAADWTPAELGGDHDAEAEEEASERMLMRPPRN